jgi:hypothetical protein
LRSLQEIINFSDKKWLNVPSPLRTDRFLSARTIKRTIYINLRGSGSSSGVFRLLRPRLSDKRWQLATKRSIILFLSQTTTRIEIFDWINTIYSHLYDAPFSYAVLDIAAAVCVYILCSPGNESWKTIVVCCCCFWRRRLLLSFYIIKLHCRLG